MLKNLRKRMARWWLAYRLERAGQRRIELQYDAAEVQRDRDYYDQQWAELNVQLTEMDVQGAQAGPESVQ